MGREQAKMISDIDYSPIRVAVERVIIRHEQEAMLESFGRYPYKTSPPVVGIAMMASVVACHAHQARGRLLAAAGIGKQIKGRGVSNLYG